MRAGPMRHRVRIERRSTTPDNSGEPLDEWTKVIERRASMRRETTGTEPFTSQQRQGRVPTEFRIRYETGVEPQMRLVLTSVTPNKYYDVKSAVDVDGMGETLVITAEEHVGATT